MTDFTKLQDDPAVFRSCLLIDAADAGPKALDAVIDPRQRDDFLALDPAWRRVVGQKVDGDYRRRAWIERGRGGSKSSDVMVQAVWALFAAKSPIHGVCVAVDQDQAGICRNHAARLLSLNPWLEKLLDVQQWRVVNKATGSRLEILSSDVASSYGLLIDFAVTDELSLWPKRDLFDSILSSAAKRGGCLLLCIMNAGFQESWTWQLRQSIMADSHWYFSHWTKPAPWITQGNLDEQRRLLPSAAYSRLWENEWCGAGGDALSAEILERAFRRDLAPMTQAVPGWVFCAGVDLGVSRDFSALCVLAVRDGKVRLARTRVWKPLAKTKVDLSAVELSLIKAHAEFRLKQINYDPWQAVGLAQRLQSDGAVRMASGHHNFTAPGHGRRVSLPMVEIVSTQKNLQAMASVCIESFNDGRIELFEDTDLRRDLSRMRVEERPQGFRLVFPRDQQTGHGDLGCAFLLALLAASELSGQKRVTAGPIHESNPYERYDRERERMDAHLKKLEQLGPHYGCSPFSPSSRSRLAGLLQASGRFAAGQLRDPNIILPE
jgi:hypothetical protein